MSDVDANNVDDAFNQVIADINNSGQPDNLRSNFTSGLKSFLNSATQDQKVSAYLAQKVVISQHLGPGQVGTGWSRIFHWYCDDTDVMRISVESID